MKHMIYQFLALLCYAGLIVARLTDADNSFHDAVLSKRADSTKAGYLAVYWKSAETGVFFALSTNEDPLNFTEVNGGKPMFVPTVGTKVIRDVSIVSGGGDEADSKWYILGTDLNIGATTWDQSMRTGSKGILTYESTDLLNWTDERLVVVEESTAGMVWAPDALWDNELGAYFVTWSSKFYEESDTNHTGDAITPLYVRAALTNDFTTYQAPTTYINNSPSDTLDQAFMRINDTALIRFIVGGGLDGPSVEVSYNGLLGDWAKPAGSIAAGYEGPYGWWDNEVDGKAWLLCDLVGGSAGLRGWYSDEPESGLFTRDASSDPTYMRHGSVLAITQKQYDALANL